MRSLRFILIFISPLLITSVYAQDAVFSQFYSSALYLNPALAGVEKETFFGANYRSQWSNISLPFNTCQASFIQPVFQRGMKKRHLGGVGASMLNDVAGANNEFSTQAFSIAAAWNIHLSRSGNHFISVAVQTGIGQQRISYGDLRWSSQYSSATGFDGTLPGESSLTSTRVFRPLLNAGLLWSYSMKGNKPLSFYNGFVVSNLPKTKSYFAGMAGDQSLVLKMHGGVTAALSTQLEISPNYLVQVQGVNKQINLGTYIGYSLSKSKSANNLKLVAGAWYRLNDGMIFSAGVATRKINVGFSYDNNMTSMGRTFGYAAAYEVSVAYRVPGKNNFKRISSPLI
jgi:type IX secretion system PorP/SprF family membrane protein